MFKTVRVGDTALQYAIVSQSDESAAGAPCPIATSPHRAKMKRKTRYRKTVILILITLIMGCCVVIAAVLVPILVASKLVGNLPESAKFQTFAIAASSIQGYNKYDHNGRRYVELLPVKEPPINDPPVNALIEFQDVRNSLSEPFKSDAFGGARQQVGHSAASGTVPVSTASTNASKVTSYSANRTKNVIADQQGIKLSSSTWNSTSRLIAQTTTFMMQRRVPLIIVGFSLTLLCFLIVNAVRHQKRKSISPKVETIEQRAQRKQLLAIPIEDD